tara:strand:- start:1428 stop:2159 length:732 start_codon:yes stop_codon:yes gene_type:complete
MGRDWLDVGKKRLIYLEFISGSAGDLFSNMCGGASVGTLGFGGKDTFKKQARDLASGINLPNKTIVQFILEKTINDERPILENYLQNMLLTFVLNNNLKIEDLNNYHSVWMSGHPHWNNNEPMVEVIKEKVQNIGWDFLPISLIPSTRESLAWTLYFQSTPQYILDYKHKVKWKSVDPVNLIIKDEREELYDLCSWFNNDIDKQIFDFVYDNYREIRMPVFEKFYTKRRDWLDKCWDSCYNIE